MSFNATGSDIILQIASFQVVYVFYIVGEQVSNILATLASRSLLNTGTGSNNIANISIENVLSANLRSSGDC